ncbi:uncharacterized protein METZ01_LOCUS361329, partial [marine metagenome]
MNPKTLIKNIVNGDRNSLSKAITLCESALDSDQKIAREIITSLLPYSQNSIRIGITGAPGVGKSTFIESFGKMLTAMHKK